MSEALIVSCMWLEFNYGTRRFEPVSETPTILPHRETARMLLITFPSGWVKRARKYGRRGGKALSGDCEYLPLHGSGYKLSWNPELYTIKQSN